MRGKANFRWQSGLTLLAVLAVIVSTGCDGRPRRVTVSGQVLIDGEPVTTGNIGFVPAEGRAAVGRIDSEGRFELSCYEPGDGAILGQHRLKVSSRTIRPGGGLNWIVPRKYADFRTSGLTFEVTEATDDAVIELTWEGEKKKKKK